MRPIQQVRAPRAMPTDDTFEQFHRLIKKGDSIAVQEFMASGVDADLRSRFGGTPLMLAASEGRTPIVTLLLAEGVDVQAIDDHGVSALACAALEGHCRTIQALLGAGASLDVRPHGVSLLDYAGWGGGCLKTQRHFALLRAAGAA